MEIYDAIFSAILNILGLYVNVRVMKLFLRHKPIQHKALYLVYALVWIGNWTIYYRLQTILLTSLSMYIGLWLIAVLLYEGSMVRKAAVAAASLAINIVCEDLVWRILNSSWLQIKSAAIGSICSVFVELMLLVLIERNFKSDKNSRMPAGSYLNMILLSLGTIVVSEILLNGDATEPAQMIGLSILCLMNLTTYYLYERVADAYRENAEHAAMRQQIAMYSNQFAVIRQSQEQVRSIRHDIKNHLLLLGMYLQNHKYDQAETYLQEMQQKITFDKEYAKTGNLEVDSILNYKLNQIHALGTELNVQINVPDHTLIPAIDLNTILGNLLDNAAEALQHVEKRTLQVIMNYSKGVLYIGIYNSFDGIVKKHGNQFLSLKSDQNEHGIGLHNVEQIVEKYDGTLSIDHSTDMFKVDLLLYISLKHSIT